jgi:hypothetical protein
MVAIEYPSGRTVGQPHDADGQIAVLRDVLQAAEEFRKPGQVTHLPYEFPETRHQVLSSKSEVPPPVADAIKRNPLLLRNLLKREVPK